MIMLDETAIKDLAVLLASRKLTDGDLWKTPKQRYDEIYSDISEWSNIYEGEKHASRANKSTVRIETNDTKQEVPKLWREIDYINQQLEELSLQVRELARQVE